MLKRKGIKLCLISNADIIDKMYWLDSPIAKYFDEAVFSCDVVYVKPNSRIVDADFIIDDLMELEKIL